MTDINRTLFDAVCHERDGYYERIKVLEAALNQLEITWKNYMARGDKRGEDIADGINVSLEMIRAALAQQEKADD